jgi:flagellar motor switch protein FliG
MAGTAVALTGVQKSAILLVALGDDVSAELLRRLSDDEVESVTNAIAKLPAISVQQAEAVLAEFHAATSDPSRGGRGGSDFARRLITSAFGAEGAKKHLQRLPGSRDGGAGQLEKVDPQLLARLVRSEHPQTVALVLAHLNRGQSGAVLASMDAPLRADVAARIAQLDQISPEVVEKISAAIGAKLEALGGGKVKRESSGGPRAVAEILNQIDSELSEDILNQIADANSDLSDEIRQKMFVFEDLLRIDANGVKELLGRADRRQLTVALKGTSDELRQHLLKGMSQRGAAMLLEDMEALGPVKIKDVEAAQQQVIAVVRQLESDGVISRNKGGGGGGGSDEQYV